MLQKQCFGGTVDVVPQARMGGAFAPLTIDAEYRCDFHITFVFKSWAGPESGSRRTATGRRLAHPSALHSDARTAANMSRPSVAGA
jgi:hypothetical protein